MVNTGLVTALMPASLSTCLKWKTNNRCKEVNRKKFHGVKKNSLLQMSVSLCDQLNGGVNKKKKKYLCDEKFLYENVCLREIKAAPKKVICLAFVFIICQSELDLF